MGKKKKSSKQTAVSKTDQRESAESTSTSKVPEWFTISDLEQLSVLANPRRQKILGEFIEEARTTKQVADRLGEPPTRLYHHVDALVKHGLLVLERESPKRGTTEKYYRAVASQFRVDDSCLSNPKFVDENSQMVCQLLDNAREKILDALAHPENGDLLHTISASSLVTTTEKGIEKISDSLINQLNQVSGKSASKSKDKTNSYRIAILIFPEDA